MNIFRNDSFPWNEWWGVRKFFRAPSIHFFKCDINNSPIYIFDDVEEHKYVYTQSYVANSKIKEDGYVSVERLPYFLIVLFGKFCFGFTLGSPSKDCDDFIYWETLLYKLYHKVGVFKTIDYNTWTEHNSGREINAYNCLTKLGKRLFLITTECDEINS